MNATPELFEKAKENGVELHKESYLDALKTSLRELFKFPVFSNEKRTWNSATVFMHYKNILRCLGKTVNDFVEQERIDNFIEQLIKVYALKEIRAFTTDNMVWMSESVFEKLCSAKMEFSRMASHAFNYADKFKNVHNWYSEWESETFYNDMKILVRVNKYRVYILIPVGKEDFVCECAGWLSED